MSENKNNTPGCNCCQDDHEAVIRNLQELVRNLDSCCNNRSTIIKNQKGEIDKLRESNRALHEENDKLKRKNEVVRGIKNEVIRGMQSKIAKQSNEIKQLTEENEKLRDHHAKMSNMIDKLNDDASGKEILYHDLWLEKNSLKKALDTAAKDAGANFDRGYRKGMEELWAAIKKLQDKSPSKRFDICGFRYMNALIANLSAQDFAKKVTEWEEKEAHDIKIGDEVISISPFGSDDSECFIVYSIEEKADGTIIYHSIGSGSSLSFSKKAIADGSVRKTGKHYDSVPFDYIC